jgi:DNA polymerase III subunit epsilon
VRRQPSNNLVVIDVETTGTNAALHSPLAIALVPVSTQLPALEIFVRPKELHWNDYARANFWRFESEWHGRAVEPVRACVEIQDYFSKVFSGEPVTLVGHNVGFDLAFLNKLALLGGLDRFHVVSHRSIDVHTLLYLLVVQRKAPISALSSDGAFEFFRIQVPQEARHTALADAIATRVLLMRIMRQLLGWSDASDDEVAADIGRRLAAV